jgi:hypothetical protein
MVTSGTGHIRCPSSRPRTSKASGGKLVACEKKIVFGLFGFKRGGQNFLMATSRHG